MIVLMMALSFALVCAWTLLCDWQNAKAEVYLDNHRRWMRENGHVKAPPPKPSAK